MIVQVKQGKLKGIENTSALSGKPFYSFLGIPYAKPPLGDLRFQPPVPADCWDGVRDADKEGNECAQIHHLSLFRTGFVGSEDCLYLNVHTPQLPSEIQTKKAVMVFIHGGGFAIGSASPRKLYSPDFLMDKDIIYVAMNYRLNVFGFLNLGVKSCQGNAGMKDQAMALKWIKENISNFGGDPENITIFGESAGAASVHLHMLSPASIGLFNRAIGQSGNAFSPWCITKNPIEEGFKLGRLLGFQEEDPEKLVQFLKEKSPNDLLTAFSKMEHTSKKNHPAKCVHFMFFPSVEVIKENAFLPESPDELIKVAEPIPFLTGMNKKEGFLLLLALDIFSVVKLVIGYSQAIKDNFKFDETEINAVIKKVKEFNSKSQESRIQQLFDLYTDIYFLEFYKSFDYIAKSNVPVYLYEYFYDGGLNFTKNYLSRMAPLCPSIGGAAHGDELGYLFHSPFLNEKKKFSETDRKVIENMCSLWTNFAKTGNPSQGMTNLDWTPSKPENPCYLQINEDLQLIQGNIEEERFTFWKNLLAEHKQQL